MRHSSLGRRIGKSPTDPEVIERMGREAFHRFGLVLVPLAEVACDWTRQAVTNWAEARWGKRQPQGSNR
jgi:hypothetical protein